ncbi:MAG: aminopeptidase P family protein [Planctomycetes bacterium]|nr:aminopeptidase P family protein [Planctomycetota bacterium]
MTNRMNRRTPGTYAFLAFLMTLRLYGGGPGAAAEAPALPTAAEWQKEYQSRRAMVLEKLAGLSKEGGTLFLRAPEPATFANDVEYPYRTDNRLFYLCGLAQNGVALLLSTKEIAGLGKEILFLKPEHPMDALWVGKPLDAQQAAAVSGIPVASIASLDKLGEVLQKAVGGSPHHFHARSGNPPAAFFYNFKKPFGPGEPVSEDYGFLLKHFGSRAFHLDLRHPAVLLDPFRQVKSAGELAMLRTAIETTCKAHRLAMQITRAGLHEYHLATEIEAVYRREGSRGWAFPSIVGSGPNSCILHYQRYDRRLEDGDVVIVDIGAEFGHYAADITRTLPVSGHFSERQKAVYQIVYNAQEAAFRAIKPGLPFGEVNRIAKDVVAEELLKLGLIEKKEDSGRYFPHGTSHGLGLDVHDPMPLDTLKPGMVFTVEPGIYIPQESLGVRLEDDVLVTEDGCEVLSRSAPRSLEEVERWMRTGSF